jgi:outer membrane protein assembly factor BamB
MPATLPAPETRQAPPPRDARRTALILTAWLAGAFSLLVAGTMLYLHLTATTSDPWKSPQLLALKERLAADPNNEQLQKEIRELDAKYREKFRHRINLDKSGGWLLLAGALALMAAAKGAGDLTKGVELSPLKTDAEEQAMRLARRSRWSVAAASAAVSAVLLWVALAVKDVPSDAGKAGPAATAAAPEQPTVADFQANSPRFRGWDGSGFSSQTNAPLSWDAKTGAGIAWKAALPAPGHNSPIIWSNRVFLSGGTAARRAVFAYDSASGNLLWQRVIENVLTPAPKMEVFEDTGYAASTMATDGHFVFAIFANGDVAALSFEGALAWTKALGPLRNPYGHAASLAIWPGKLLVQLDQGDNVAGNSKLVALETGTGRVLWERSRPVTASWATPIVVQAAGGAQILTAGQPWVIGYSCEDGAERWRAKLLEGEVVPSPVLANGLLLVVNPSAQLIALRTDGAGDVTKSALVWTNEENVPDITSPVSNGELVFTANSSGSLTCFDAKNGAKLWEKDLETQVNASPAIVGNRVFVLGLEGTAVVAEAARQFKEIARSQLPDRFIASPAFAGGRTFLRGETNLYCIKP